MMAWLLSTPVRAATTKGLDRGLLKSHKVA